MQLFIGFVLGIVSGLVANYVSPSLNRLVDSSLGWLFHLLDPDRFDLTGTWEQTFAEPTEDAAMWEEVKELVNFRHLGARVTGKGTTRDNGRIFSYDLRVQHNLVFGSYRKTGAKGNVAGNGVVQMIVSPDRLSMKGQATWFDHDTEKIESGECQWEKISSALEPTTSEFIAGVPVKPPIRLNASHDAE